MGGIILGVPNKEIQQYVGVCVGVPPKLFRNTNFHMELWTIPHVAMRDQLCSSQHMGYAGIRRRRHGLVFTV